MKTSNRQHKGLLDGFKEIIMTKVDVYGASAKAVYKFIEMKGDEDDERERIQKSPPHLNVRFSNSCSPNVYSQNAVHCENAHKKS